MVTSGVKNVFFRLESVPAHLRWTARSAHRRSETEPAWNGQHGKHQSPVSGVMKMSSRGIFIYIYIIYIHIYIYTATLIWCGPIPSLNLSFAAVGFLWEMWTVRNQQTSLSPAFWTRFQGSTGSTTPRPDWNPTVTAGISDWGEPWPLGAWSLHGACISVSPSFTMSPGKIWKWPCSNGMLAGNVQTSWFRNVQHPKKSMLLSGSLSCFLSDLFLQFPYSMNWFTENTGNSRHRGVEGRRNCRWWSPSPSHRTDHHRTSRMTLKAKRTGGKWWKMVENGGKWWKMVENGGKWWKTIEIAIKAKGESFETNPDTESNWAKTCVDVFGLPVLTRTK